MRNNKRTSQRYALDGFVPRKGSTVNRPRRPTIDSTPRKSKRETTVGELSEMPTHHDSHTPVVFDDNERVAGSLREPVDLGDLPDDKPKKPHWWQLRKRREYAAKKRVQASHRKRIIKRILLIILLLMVLVGVFLGWRALKNTSRIFDGNVLGLFSNDKLKGENEGRVNILLAGTSEDDGPDHGGADLTDSIMLVSLDTKNNTAFTVSIPRDLWVDYEAACSAGYAGKINVVYQCGEDISFDEPGYAQGGMGMLSKIVSEHFGLPIHYYGKINYTAFRDAVNAVGGIDVTIESDDPRGIYDPNIAPQDGGPLRLENGTQKLNGERALALARSRNSAGGYGMARGDFDRAKYQRMMLLALKDKALSAGILTNPARVGELFDAAGDNVKTDFQTSELRRLYEIGKNIESKNVTSIDLASEEVNLLKTGSFNGQSIVMPVAGISDFSDIQAFFAKLTSNDPMVREGASIVVLNGSGVAGAAQKQADIFTAKGLDVPIIANASQQQESTILIDKSQGAKNATKEFLQTSLGVEAVANSTAYAETSFYESDFIIIVGRKSTTVAVR